MQRTDHPFLQNSKPLITPRTLLERLPASPLIHGFIEEQREQVRRILRGEDHRLLVVVGPCSIHDPIAALAYAKRLKSSMARHGDALCILMRLYFEKPRTRFGWKGLIHDPRLDGSNHVNEGLQKARELMLAINALGVPAATEFLDTLIPAYLIDLTTWSAIGARTSESQLHRQLASGLPIPVGFKNNTQGDVQVAIDAVCAAEKPQHYLGINDAGLAVIHETHGNKAGHVILRGSNTAANYDTQSIAAVVQQLKQAKLPTRIMVDCSHGNSGKDPRQQALVAENLAKQISDGDTSLMGIMMESHINAGRQDYLPNKPLNYGQSITDACLDWDTTEHLLTIFASASKARSAYLNQVSGV